MQGCSPASVHGIRLKRLATRITFHHKARACAQDRNFKERSSPRRHSQGLRIHPEAPTELPAPPGGLPGCTRRTFERISSTSGQITSANRSLRPGGKRIPWLAGEGLAFRARGLAHPNAALRREKPPGRERELLVEAAPSNPTSGRVNQPDARCASSRGEAFAGRPCGPLVTKCRNALGVFAQAFRRSVFAVS